jgi:hypothetical protein
MPKRIKLPNGATGVFPDSMNDAQIEGVLQKQFPSAQHAPAKATPLSLKEKAKGWVREGANALPMIGSTLGGIGGGLAATPADVVGGPVPTAVGAVGGAALGGAFGESLRQDVDQAIAPKGTPRMSTGQRLKADAMQGVVQGSIQGLTDGLSTLVKPTLKAAVSKLYYATNIGAKYNGLIEGVTEDLAHAAEMMKTRPKTIGQFHDLVKSAQRISDDEVAAAVAQPVQNAGKRVMLNHVEVMPTGVADRISSLGDSHISEQEMNPARAAAIKKAALNYQKPRTFAWLNDRRQVLNAELTPFYSMTAAEKGVYRTTHPNIDIEAEEANAIRETLYPLMDRAAGKPEGYFENLQRRNGQLKDLGKQVEKRINTLDATTKASAGAPWYERGHVSAYATDGRAPRFTLHGLTNVLKSPNLTGRADKAVASAFSRKITRRVASKLVIPAASLPLRYIGGHEDDDSQIPPAQNAGDAKRRLKAVQQSQ